MHAYLFVGSEEKLHKAVSGFAESISAKVYPMQLESIKDTRLISSFVKLAQHKNVLIFIKNIQNASNDALQAFLKNLEEPNEHIFYALHTTNEALVLPTIRSRCQIVYLKKDNGKKDPNLPTSYIDSDIPQKLGITDQFKNRGEALEFIDDLLLVLHQKLVSNPSDKITNKINLVINTRKNLASNGNVFLHLSLMSLKFDMKS